MIRKVDALEVSSFQLAEAVAKVIPESYRLHPVDPADDVAVAWKEAIEAAVHAWCMMEDLGCVLREKAGLAEDGPTAMCRLP
jgi:hypothetical protein